MSAAVPTPYEDLLRDVLESGTRKSDRTGTGTTSVFGRQIRFDPADADAPQLGARATLVQFSTEMCTRCPQVRRMLTGVAADHEGLDHIEVDLTRRPDLSARYRVLQTPTTFVVDRSGAVRARFNGIPPHHALTEAIAAL